MTIIPFPQPHTAADKRAQIEALARELGGVILWNDDPRGKLTPREESVLTALYGHRTRTGLSVAVQLGIEHSWVCEVCRRLVAKGYAVRAKGGWMRLDRAHDNIMSSPLALTA
jgi:hypothetical protein